MSGSTINIALSGMKTSQNQLALASHNIASADVDGYSAKKAPKGSFVIDNAPQGVFLHRISTETDDFLESQLLKRISEEAEVEIKHRHYSNIENYLGRPGKQESINHYIDNMFEALNTLSTRTETSSLKTIAVQEITEMTHQISGLAKNLETLRLTIDQDMSTEVQGLNTELENLNIYNTSLLSLQKGTLEYAQVNDDIQGSLQKISEYFEIKVFTSETSGVTVITENGFNLIGGLNYYLEYEPQIFIENFINEDALNPMHLRARADNGNDYNFNLMMTKNVPSKEVAHSFASGKIAGMLDMRDREIPNILDQLDNLAKKLKDELNKAHNSGTGFPPPEILNGTYLVSRTQDIGFSGKVRIALVDDFGVSITEPAISALTLDLGSLDTGNGKGVPNLHGIMQEINYFFDERMTEHKKVAVGDISDIKLVSKTQAFTAGGVASFDIELENMANNDAIFEITNVAASGGASAGFDSATYTCAAGERQRTGGATGAPSIDITLPATLSYPYTISVSVLVTNHDGTSYNTKMEYIIGDTNGNAPDSDLINGLLNTRFSVDSITGGVGQISDPQYSNRLLHTTLVDKNKSTLPAFDDVPGMLEIQAAPDFGYRVAIDVMDSSYTGAPSKNIMGTGDNFSTFFGLNDLLVRTDAVENWGNTKNSAVFLNIRNDIKKNANHLALGKLHSVFNDNDPDSDKNYAFEVSSGDNSNLITIQEVSKTLYFFEASNGLSSATTTISQYATEIINITTSNTINIANKYDHAELLSSALKDRLSAIKGVDVNEELANSIFYQRLYSACAKMIAVAKEFDEILLNIVK